MPKHKPVKLKLPRGFKDDDYLFVHASCRRLFQFGIMPNELIGSLISLVPRGALILPSFSWRSVSIDGNYNYLHTKSNVGFLPEYFRTNFPTLRSNHPTHSVCAFGPQALDATSGHELSKSQCGLGSPFDKLLNRDGWIMMINTSIENCSMFHYFEEIWFPETYLARKEDETKFLCRWQDNSLNRVSVTPHKRLPRNYYRALRRLESDRSLYTAYASGVVYSMFKTSSLNRVLIMEKKVRGSDFLIERGIDAKRFM